MRPGAISPRVRLRAWIAAAGLADAPIEQLERLSLDGFLEQTAAIALPGDERLRELAILIEPAAVASPQPRGWTMLLRLYAKAARQAPENPWLGHSQAVAALSCADRRLPDPVRAQIFADARAALETALFSHPREARLLEALGELCYRSGLLEEASSWCARALRVDPGLAWASLYRAQALMDLEHWAEAAVAFEVVPASLFVGPAAWRQARLLEQRGWCRVKTADNAGALRDFEQALAIYELDPELAERAMSRILVTAAARIFPAALRSRTLAVAHEVHWRWAQDMLTPVED